MARFSSRGYSGYGAMDACSEQSLRSWALPKGYSKACPMQFLTPIVQDWRYTNWHLQQNGFAGSRGPLVECDIVKLLQWQKNPTQLRISFLVASIRTKSII